LDSDDAYHWDESGVGPFLGYFEIQERPELLRLLKIELIEATYAGQENTVLEFPHVSEGLEHNCRIRRGLGLDRQGFQGNEALGQLV
jgi:hypothetical protein